MPYSGVLCRVALVRADVSEELSASFIREITQGHLATRFRIHSVFTNNPARPFYRSLGPPFVLWPFTTQATILPPTPLHPQF
jgi:hypothetical protein